jgi:membrane protein DedA with SNARE-associated domain
MEPKMVDSNRNARMQALEETPSPPERRRQRRQMALLVGPIIVLVVASFVGDALTSSLADTHPLVLVLLNARNRILILTTNQLDAVSYYVAGTFRLVLSDPLFYMVGMLYGDSAVRWIERKSPTYGQLVRTIEESFHKATYPLVFIAPNNFICIFAGAAGMGLAAFVTLNVTGTLVRLYLIRRLGDAFQAPIDDVLDFFARFRIPLLLLSVAITAFVVWRDVRKGSFPSSLDELENQLDDEGEDEDDRSRSDG